MARIVWEGTQLLLYFGFSKHQQQWIAQPGRITLLPNAAAALCKRMTGCSDLTAHVFLLSKMRLFE
ncbi:hypothetical protein [Rhizobium leguminosarum]|uniref:hypothetical protein n=1 Tax=Rhizobium leguminosarum TaxID=384 RepID=UPI001C98E0FF|nr:hypothetical protein [Rhizobium leguminosarum]MBY5618788.1 hypothetical protein [Rhizobium leguminosarum]